MSDEQNSNSTIDSEELETDEKEQFRLHLDEWLELCLENMFSSLLDDDLRETEETKDQLGECNITRDHVGKERE
jgi:hypothetical protein